MSIESTVIYRTSNFYMGSGFEIIFGVIMQNLVIFRLLNIYTIANQIDLTHPQKNCLLCAVSFAFSYKNKIIPAS